MSAGAITQLIASGGNASYYEPTLSYEPSCMSNDTQQPNAENQLKTYVCLNQQCFVNQPSKFGNIPAFGSLEECQKVCGIKPSTRRAQ
jgi:hypothetical protein